MPTPPVGTCYGWDGDLLSEEAPLAADGTPDWDRAVRWHYEPGTFRPATGQYQMFGPSTPENILNNGAMDYPSVTQWAQERGLPNTFQPSGDLPEGYRYGFSDPNYQYNLWGHGADPNAPPGQGPTTSMKRKPCCGGKGQKLTDQGSWGSLKPSTANHIPLINSPY